jgi:hypothetical protein
MTEYRERMMSAFKTRFVPALRKRGFVGSFPHFRRLLPDRVDYLMVQFYSAGGSFVVEVGRTGPNGFTEGPWKDLPVDKISVGPIFHDRRRLEPRDAHGGWRGGNWFEFGPRSYDPPQPIKPQEFTTPSPTRRSRSRRHGRALARAAGAARFRCASFEA